MHDHGESFDFMFVGDLCELLEDFFDLDVVDYFSLLFDLVDDVVPQHEDVLFVVIHI